MNKFLKWSIAGGVTASFAELLNQLLRHDLLTRIHDAFTEDRQLTHQLTERVKAVKTSSGQFSQQLKALDLSKLNRHLNNFEQQLQPQIDRLQASVERIQNDRKR